MPNREELYFTPDISKPHQKWLVLEDPERPGRRPLIRHYRQPGEKPDVRTSFGSSELSPVLEHYAAKAGIEYSRRPIWKYKLPPISIWPRFGIKG